MEQSRYQKKDTDSKRKRFNIKVFNKEIWWFYIVLILFLILSLSLYMYITFIKQKRKDFEKMCHVQQRHKTKFPSFDFKNLDTSASSSSLIQQNSKNLSPTRTQVLQLFDNAEMLIPIVSGEKKWLEIKPEDEWQGRAGLKWIAKKREALNKICSSPSPQNRKSGRMRSKNILSRYKNTVSIQSSRVFEDISEQSSSVDDACRNYRQDWSKATGVFNLFNYTSEAKICAKIGAQSLLNNRDNDEIFRRYDTINTGFDSAYELLMRRHDQKYNEATWWEK